MNKKRRYHITETQGQVVRLALEALLERLECELSKNPNDRFWNWLQTEALKLKQELTNYEWRVTTNERNNQNEQSNKPT